MRFEEHYLTETISKDIITKINNIKKYVSSDGDFACDNKTPSCGAVSELIGKISGVKLGGTWFLKNNKWSHHAYNVYKDGTIIDATVDQWKIKGYPGVSGIAIIPVGHPWRKYYDWDYEGERDDEGRPINKLTEKFKTFIRTRNWGTVEILVDPDRDEINNILRNPESHGVRMGVINENEIYAWDAEVLHSIVQSYLYDDGIISTKFKLTLTYDKESKNIFDSSQDEYDEFPKDKKALLRKIKPKINYLFPDAKIDKKISD